jgi:gamma-glutamylaminecyclotransferase
MYRKTVAMVRPSQDQPASRILLFVYGTLRRGFENHEAYLKGSLFMGRAVTCDKFALFMEDFPYMNKVPAVSFIVGEIYQVNEGTLKHIDSLEGHPEEYRRELITVVTQQGRKYAAWAYFYPRPRGELIPSGDFAAGVKL